MLAQRRGRGPACAEQTFHSSKGWGGQLGRGCDLKMKNYSLAFFHCGKQKRPIPTKAVLSPEHPFHSSMEVAPPSFLPHPPIRPRLTRPTLHQRGTTNMKEPLWVLTRLPGDWPERNMAQMWLTGPTWEKGLACSYLECHTDAHTYALGAHSNYSFVRSITGQTLEVLWRGPPRQQNKALFPSAVSRGHWLLGVVGISCNHLVSFSPASVSPRSLQTQGGVSTH